MAGWLRGRTDADLLELFRLRPDLALPAPVDLSSLASRAGVRSSVARALDQLDAFCLRVLEVVAAVDDVGAPTSTASIAAWFAPEDGQAVDAALTDLSLRALIWPTTSGWQLVGAGREVLGSFPAGVGRPARELFGALTDSALAPLLRYLGLPTAPQPEGGRTVADTIVERLPQLIADSGEAERGILSRLAAGPPIGSFRGADPRQGVRPAAGARAGTVTGGRAATSGADETASPARTLLARGLLVATDRDTVQLPREISVALRPVPAGDVGSAPVPIATRTVPGSQAVDGGGTTAVLETVRLIRVLCDDLAANPVVPLRSGGVGVRDLKRIARTLDVTEDLTGLLLEIAYESGLIALTGGVEDTYLPTVDFDSWVGRPTAAQWLTLAEAWLAMTRQPNLVGARDERDKTIAALSADIERHSAPTLRQQVLALLAELPDGQTPTSVEDVLDALAWRTPRRASTTREAARSVLAEAAALGVTGYGAVPGYTRALLEGGSAAARAATGLLTESLPEPVSEFLLQPDLTVVVPGPPAAELALGLGLAADLESTGGAAVYRISPASLRRALDTGRTAADLTAFFTEHSRTPMPQALQYMINDIATQHGRLRVGVAASYLRSDDESVIERVMSDRSLAPLGLIRLAPTVVVAERPVADLLDRLREAGFTPAAESAEGRIVALAVDAPRAPGRPHSRLARIRPSRPDDGHLADLVDRMRAADRLATAIDSSTQKVAQQIPGVTSASILELLRTAVRQERTIAFNYVDDTGTSTQKVLMPISVAGGVVRGHEPDGDRPGENKLYSYPLQRITTVSVLDL